MAIEKGDDVYLVSVFMNSDVEEGYWQCKCTSMKLSATAAPEIVVDQMQLTNNGGDRPCNHPKIATDGEHIVVIGWCIGAAWNPITLPVYINSRTI